MTAITKLKAALTALEAMHSLDAADHQRFEDDPDVSLEVRMCRTSIADLRSVIAELEATQNDAERPSIKLNKAEVQSGVSRVRWAEGLIRQLPEDHDGRNSWLLNYSDASTGSFKNTQAMHKSLLPEPAYRRLSDLQSGVDDYYTADQMRQMRIDTLEEAALACEKRLETGAHLRCATDIRALKEKKHE